MLTILARSLFTLKKIFNPKSHYSAGQLITHNLNKIELPIFEKNNFDEFLK